MGLPFRSICSFISNNNVKWTPLAMEPFISLGSIGAVSSLPLTHALTTPLVHYELGEWCALSQLFNCVVGEVEGEWTED